MGWLRWVARCRGHGRNGWNGRHRRGAPRRGLRWDARHRWERLRRYWRQWRRLGALPHIIVRCRTPTHWGYCCRCIRDIPVVAPPVLVIIAPVHVSEFLCTGHDKLWIVPALAVHHVAPIGLYIGYCAYLPPFVVRAHSPAIAVLIAPIVARHKFQWVVPRLHIRLRILPIVPSASNDIVLYGYRRLCRICLCLCLRKPAYFSACALVPYAIAVC